MYERRTTQNLIKTAAAHSRMPNAEFIEAIAKQLVDADALITAMGEEKAKDRVESERIRKQEESLVDELRKLRESTAPMPELVRVLRQIAISPKGAKPIAFEFLAKFNLFPAPPAPDALPKIPAKRR